MSHISFTCQIPKTFAKVCIEAIAVGLAYHAAHYIRFDQVIPPRELDAYPIQLPALIAIRLSLLALVTRYRPRWRSTSLVDFGRVLYAVTLGSIAFAAMEHWLHTPFSRGILALEWFFSLNFLMAVRIAARISWNRWSVRMRPAGAQFRRVLVVGAGDAGESIVRQMHGNPKASGLPVGFVDDDPAKMHRLIQGVEVRGTISDLPRLLAGAHVDQVLVAIPSLAPSRLRDIVKACGAARVEITMLPSLEQLTGMDPTTRMIRKARVEDLLERSPVKVNLEEVAAYTRGQRILITGAGGSIGSELCRQLVTFGPAEMILLGHGENSLFWIDYELRHEMGFTPQIVVADIGDRERLEAVFERFRPTVVFHAAAHKHVPLMEANPEEAVRNNIFGTLNLAEMSVRFGVLRFVMISTDKAVNPTSVMGVTKRVAERIVQSMAQRIEAAREGHADAPLWGFDGVGPASAKTRFAAVRFGNVLGSRGSVVPTMEHQIARGGPVTVTHPDMVRYFMTIPEAVQLVIQAGAMGNGGEIFVLDMGKPVRIMDLAWNMIRLSGLVPDVDIQIVVTGVRPGEKLREEVLTAEEGTTVTNHSRIFVAKPSQIDHWDLCEALKDLDDAMHCGDRAALRLILSSLVPTYQPSKSAPMAHHAGSQPSQPGSSGGSFR